MRVLCMALLMSSVAFGQSIPITYAPSTVKEKTLTADDLRADPQLLNTVFIGSIEEGYLDAIKALLPLYEELPNANPQTLRYAKALISREAGDFGTVIRELRAFLEQEPQSVPVQMLLAQALFVERHDLEAKALLNEIPESALPAHLVEMRSNMLSALEKRQEVQFSGGGHYLYEPNINSAPSVREYGNWRFPEAQSAHGVHVNLGAEKQFPLANGFFIPVKLHADTDYYWDAKDANDLQIKAATGIGKRSATSEWRIEPYYNQRFVGGDAYSQSYGTDLMWRQALNREWQLRLNSQIGYEKYEKRVHLDGKRLALSGSLFYSPAGNWYSYIGLNGFHHEARDAEDQFNSVGASVGGGYRFNNGLNTNLSANVSRRVHDDSDIFRIRRKDWNYRMRMSASHEKIEWKGFAPQLVLEMKRTDSNHFYYDRPFKAQVMLEVEKRF